MPSVRLFTHRLEIVDVIESDLDSLLAIATSNPEFLAAHEGSDGVPGRYDRGMLERDLAVAGMDPHRHALTIRLREDGDVVGRADVVTEHPHDGLPWIGLLEIRADVQRRGYGQEAAGALVEWARAAQARSMRVSVDAINTSGTQFWVAFGFREVDRRTRSSPSGPVEVLVLELPLEATAEHG